MMEVLPQCYFKIAAVILDIRCLIKKDQPMEDAGFIATALQSLDMYYPQLPRYVLTGDDVAFDQFKVFFKHEKVFLKTPEDIEALFVEIQLCIEKSVYIRIKRENPDVFHIFDSGKMDVSAEHLLAKILEDGMNEKSFIKFKGICAQVRSFQELIYKSINRRNQAVVPNNMFHSNGMIKFNDLMKHLSGNPSRPGSTPSSTVYQNNTIFNLSNYIYWSCGEYVHEDPDRDYEISHNTLRSLIYGLMELILWSGRY